jgi:hypothetical protein
MSVSPSVLVDVLLKFPWLMRVVVLMTAALLAIRVLFAVRPRGGQPKKPNFSDRAWSSQR